MTIVFGGLAFGVLGAGAAYQTVDASHGLPIEIVSAIPAGTNLIGQIEISDGANVLGTVAHPVQVTVSNEGFAVVGSVTVVDSIALDVALNAGSNNAGFFTPAPAGQTVGATPFKLTAAAASTNATSLKAAAGTLWEIVALNVSASAVAYLKLYDKASAPTVGTDTPVYVAPIPTAGSANGAGVRLTFPVGLKFANGIAYAITGGMGDADTTAIAAGQVMLSGSYQ
ncbi:MAG TPA: hypothetical protein VFX03_03035 [Thermomicrobiales bacterium]|nr:hypothetical protein [Thermomicrobiales bacterium]